MADPLTITKAIVSATSGCWTVGKFMYTMVDDYKKIDARAESFAKEIENLSDALDGVRKYFSNPCVTPAGTGHESELWIKVLNVVQGCDMTVGIMAERIAKVQGATPEDAHFLPKAKRQLQWYFNIDELEYKRKEIASFTSTMQLCLQMISVSGMITNRAWNESTTSRLDDLTDDVRTILNMLQMLSLSIHTMRRSTQSPATEGICDSNEIKRNVIGLAECVHVAGKLISSASTIVANETKGEHEEKRHDVQIPPGIFVFGSEYGDYVAPEKQDAILQWIERANQASDTKESKPDTAGSSWSPIAPASPEPSPRALRDVELLDSSDRDSTSFSSARQPLSKSDYEYQMGTLLARAKKLLGTAGTYDKAFELIEEAEDLTDDQFKQERHSTEYVNAYFKMFELIATDKIARESKQRLFSLLNVSQIRHLPHLTSVQYSFTLFHQARVSLYKAKLASAEEQCRRAIEADSEAVHARVLLTNILFDRKKSMEAETHYSRLPENIKSQVYRRPRKIQAPTSPSKWKKSRFSKLFSNSAQVLPPKAPPNCEYPTLALEEASRFLPKPWEARQEQQSGGIFYYNRTKGLVTWMHPCFEEHLEEIKKGIPREWEMILKATTQVLFCHSHTRSRTWEHPVTKVYVPARVFYLTVRDP